MSTPIRWRLTWWLSGSPDKARSQWYSHKCKICAAKRAQALSYVTADLARADRKTARWAVARSDGHLNSMRFVINSASHTAVVDKHHAC